MKLCTSNILPCAFIGALALLTLPTGAVPAPKTAAPPPKMTLAQALASLPPPADSLRLSVSAEQVTLPNDAPPPPADASPSDVAAAFGDQTMSFGSVTAVAPQTMTLLNPQPEPPNIGYNIGIYAASKVLFGSLDDAQWHALISEHGLGLSDLTDDIQRSLFYALFPHGQLWIAIENPALQDVPDAQRTDVQNATDQIDETRIRLGQIADINLHDTQGETIFYSTQNPNAAKRLQTWFPKHSPSGKKYGVVLQAAVPNSLKSSDLDYNSRILQAPISLVGLRTVGGLVTRIGIQTKLELYADPHYAARTLLLQGTATTEPAGDLLHALCVCVTGTFRKVGPAFVLTDDLVGVGTRRQRLSDWEAEADGVRSHVQDTLGDEAGAAMQKQRSSDARKLAGFGDPLALTPDEMAAVPDEPNTPGIPTDIGGSFPFSKLTAAQQELARQTAEDYDEHLHSDTLPYYLKDDNLTEADLTHNVTLGVQYHLQMLVPGQSQPVTAFIFPLSMLFFDQSATMSEVGAGSPAGAKPAASPAPPLSVALRLGWVRAVLGHPRTAKDVDALVLAMQKLGLNQLWLDVFSGGVSHVKASGTNGPDILTEALTRTRGTGIRVYADLSLLAWGIAPPKDVQDLTIDGQNSREWVRVLAQSAKTRNIVLDADKLSMLAAFPVQVSPASSEVQATLTDAIESLAARPGLAGFAWDDAATDSNLGYTPAMRLAFLRAAHADPVDITEDADQQNEGLQTISLPLFNDKDVGADLVLRWTKACSDTDTALLRRLAEAAQTSDGTPLPVLVGQDADTEKYIPWRGVLSDPQMLKKIKALSPAQATQFARAVSVRGEAVQNDGDTPALARQLQDDANKMPSKGFVLDFQHDGITQGAAPLESLVEAVAAERGKVSSGKLGATKTAGKAVN